MDETEPPEEEIIKEEKEEGEFLEILKALTTSKESIKNATKFALNNAFLATELLEKIFQVLREVKFSL
jgi:hypothetical protein